MAEVLSKGTLFDPVLVKDLVNKVKGSSVVLRSIRTSWVRIIVRWSQRLCYKNTDNKTGDDMFFIIACFCV